MITSAKFTVSWLNEPEPENEIEIIENNIELAVAKQVITEIFNIFGLNVTEEEENL